jgi:hypothetical protein
VHREVLEEITSNMSAPMRIVINHLRDLIISGDILSTTGPAEPAHDALFTSIDRISWTDIWPVIDKRMKKLEAMD